jgi:hypothetical protein
MGETVYNTLDTLLASVHEEVDDPELSYKLRTARQLTVVCEDQIEAYEETLEEADLDEETMEHLHQLGYLPAQSE